MSIDNSCLEVDVLIMFLLAIMLGRSQEQMDEIHKNQGQFMKLGNGARTLRPREPIPPEHADEASALLHALALQKNSRMPRSPRDLDFNPRPRS